MSKKCSLWRNVSCDQLVRIFCTGLLKGEADMCIFHSPSFLIVRKEYLGVLVSVSDRINQKKKRSLHVVSCSSANIVAGSRKNSRAACHHPQPCSRTLVSAMAAVLILQSAVSSLHQKTNSCWGFFPPAFLGQIMLWLIWCFCTVY